MNDQAPAINRSRAQTRANRGLQPQQIDLGALHQALIVLSEGSFRRAASTIGAQPSSISRRIRALEDVIGVSLFMRERRGVKPTLAGQRVLSQAQSIFADLDNLLHTAQLNGSGLEGTLSIGIVSSVVGGPLSKLIGGFVPKCRGVNLQLRDGALVDHIAAIVAHKLDVGLILGSYDQVGCEERMLWSERVMVALSYNHPTLSEKNEVSWDDLSQERFVVSQAGAGEQIGDCVIKHLASRGKYPEVEPQMVARDTLLGMVGLGLGVTLVGEAEASVSYPGVRFIPLAGESMPFYIVWSTSNDNPAMRRFLSHARGFQAREPKISPDDV